jgi:hypothetical protein
MVWESSYKNILIKKLDDRFIDLFGATKQH